MPCCRTPRRDCAPSRRFDRVDVLKRYASITDPSQILVLIQVDEGPVRIVRVPGIPGQAPTACADAGST